MDQDTLSISVNWSGRNKSVECTATVIKPFLPITKSQVFLVDVHGALNGVPSPMILKIFDPRFLEDRIGHSRDHPWSLENELAAAERRAAVIRGDRQDDYDQEDFFDFDEVLWEEYAYREMQLAFQLELAAYTRLRQLQGDGIPRCYGFGTLHPDIQCPVVPNVFLEYIRGESLSSVDPTTISRGLARTLITTVHAIGVYGVIHNDLRAENIIFSPAKPETPTKVYVIDFGHYGLREDESDSDWEECVYTLGDETRVRRHLSDLGVRDPDPQRPQIYPKPGGAVAWNRWAETEGRRWCEPVSEQWDGPECVKLVEPIRWKLRDEVTAWLDARDAGLLVGAAPPRPGSPDFIPLSRDMVEETQK
jgi:serine/threonine protein kinase